MTDAPTESKNIRMTARELELYQAGEAMGTAKGFEAAADALAPLVEQLRGYDGGTNLSRWLAALERDVALAAKPAGAPVRRKVAELVGSISATKGAPLEMQASMAKAVADALVKLKAGASPYRAQFGERLLRASRFPEPTDAKIPFVARVARRALEALAKVPT